MIDLVNRIQHDWVDLLSLGYAHPRGAQLPTHRNPLSGASTSNIFARLDGSGDASEARGQNKYRQSSHAPKTRPGNGSLIVGETVPPNKDESISPLTRTRNCNSTKLSSVAWAM